MDLLVNTVAAARSSRGVRRYFEHVLANLQWHGHVVSLKPLGVPAFERGYELLRRGRDDAILWTPCQRGPLFARHHVVTVHDCISIEYTYRSDRRLPAYMRLMQALLGRAESVVAISKATRAAVLRNFRVDPARIAVIPSGLEALRAPTGGDGAGAPSAPHVLMVTNALPHKNTLAACRAFAASRARAAGVALRVIGAIDAPSAAFCAEAGIALFRQEGISDAALAQAYRDCIFLLAPSLDEGHNLPIAEALAHGGEVLCSDIDVHREFYDGRAYYFDPMRVESIADAINTCLALRRPWFPHARNLETRTFVDVARDYERLFRAIEARLG